MAKDTMINKIVIFIFKIIKNKTGDEILHKHYILIKKVEIF